MPIGSRALSLSKPISAVCQEKPDKLQTSLMSKWPFPSSLIRTVKPLSTLVLLLLLAGIRCGWAGDDHQPVRLTPAEQAWLAQHPDIVLGAGEAWQPWVIKRGNGEISGFAADHVALLNRKLGTSIRLEAGPWHKMVEKALASTVSGLTLIANLPERKAQFLLTDVFHNVQAFIYLRSGERPKAGGLAAYQGKKLGYLKGTLRVAKQLAVYPGITAVPLEDYESLAKGLLDGSLDAVVDAYDLEYWRINHAVLGFLPTHIVLDIPSDMVIGVRKDWPELLDILNKGLRAITADEMAELYRRWFGSEYLQQVGNPRVSLTADEQAWIQAHPVVKAGFAPFWAPIEFADEKGRLQGISMAYLDRLESLLGLRFERIKTTSWQEALQGLQAGSLDVLPATSVTPERKAKLHFTQPYLSFPAVIFSASQVSYLDGLPALNGKPVAVVQNEASQEWLQTDWPELALVSVIDTQEALRKLVKGQAFAFVGNLATTSYYIGQSGLTQIKVAGETPYAYALGMAVRQDWSILAGILQKGLDAIPKEEQNQIYHDWISIEYKHAVDYTLLWHVMLAAGLILLVVFYWNRKLSREVSLRRQAESVAHTAREEADRANQAKSQLLSHVSHDLRAPLNSVLGFAQMLERDDRPLSIGQQELVDGIRRGGKHLLNLIDELLDLAKIEANHLELDAKPWDTQAMWAELDSMFRARALLKGVALTIKATPSLPRHLCCDSKRLQQILINLLDNAIKYTDTGLVSLSADYADGRLNVVVADTGIGINLEQIELIFEPFQRVDDAQQRHEGTGLGLAISNRLVECLGGAISVESTPGQGSQFHFWVPVATETGVETVQPVTPVVYQRSESDDPMRTLLVDDELTSLPQTQRERLIWLIETGDMTALMNFAEVLGQEERHSLLAEQIRALVKAFDLQGLAQVLVKLRRLPSV